MSWKIARKFAIRVGLSFLGGQAGIAAADGLEKMFDIGEGVVNASIDAAGASIGSLGAAWTGGALDNAIFSPTAPNNPRKGTLWFNDYTKELFVWTGDKWLKAKRA